MTLYKVLDGNKATNGGNYEYSLPTQNADGSWTPSEWTDPIANLVACESGYHLAKDEQLVQWLGQDIYEAEATGQIVDANDKIVCESVRLTRKITGWNDHTARLFAVWCAREALKLIDNPDPRSVNACNVAEKFANGEATKEELAAARSAAWDATWDAARDAARDATWAAARDTARDAARDAARSAAWDAAWDAARDATWAAARDTARDAQYKKLMELTGKVQE